MVKVITYGTYDLLHFGHIRLLERAKALGDYLVVGVTSDDFDKLRGKINVQQPLMERIEAVKKTGLADEIIVEEYPGQKIDDIQRMGIDIFTVGSDWEGHFDYLNEYCKVIYLDRTQGVSSSEVRAKNRAVRIGLLGDSGLSEFAKYNNECSYVNGAEVSGICKERKYDKDDDYFSNKSIREYEKYEDLLDDSEAIIIETTPEKRYEQVKAALLRGKHVICKAPVALKKAQAEELFSLAEKKQVVLMGAIKTAYATAYRRLLLLAKSGFIGNVIHIDVTCTRVEGEYEYRSTTNKPNDWGSMSTWGPFALLPVLQVMGKEYDSLSFVTAPMESNKKQDAYTQINIVYPDKTAVVKVGKGLKLEGDLIIAGTKGYIYVPAPWWKTDYFEIRYEKQDKKKKFFYQLDGEGIRFEIAAFIKAIQEKKPGNYLDNSILETISEICEKYYSGENVTVLAPIGKK